MSVEKLTLIIPAKNEEESLPLVLDELEKYKVKKIVIIRWDNYNFLHFILF